MGCCISRSGASDSDDLENAITIGKNRPLIQERIKWKSDVPMTEGQLRSKRDEFWETAPAFEGRKEIWDALRAASALAEQGDYALSQAILDGANVSLPDGTLRESYDELGNRYQIPYYCLSAPTNLIEERSSESSGGTMNGDGPTCSAIDKGSSSGANALGELQTLKIRLSTTGEDVNVDCRSKETVHTIKQRLHQTVRNVPTANQQRWLYGGRILLDKMRISDCKIPQNFIVQVVIHNVEKEKEGSRGKADQENQGQQSSASNDASTGDSSAMVTAKENLDEETGKKIDEQISILVDPATNIKRPMSAASTSKLGSHDTPVLLIPTTRPGSVQEVHSGNGNEGQRRTGSSSSRKSTGKHHHRHGKLRSRHSLSGTSSANGTTSQDHQRDGSRASKRSTESPPPVETA